MTKHKEDILKLRAEGKTYKEICNLLNCSKGTISFHCGTKVYREKHICTQCGTKLTSGSKNKSRLCSVCKGEISLITRTKGEHFKNRKNWQSARSSIQRHARKVYFANYIQPCCRICQYLRHVEVAHIKSVSVFPDTALIKEINDINNLVGLCPTHHWEYDNGYLTL